MKKTGKRRMAAVLLAAMLVAVMTGCGDKTDGEEGNTTMDENTTTENAEVENIKERITVEELLAELPPLGEIAELPDYSAAEPWDSDLYVEPVTGIDNDFIRGVDISSYLSIKESGAVFRDFEGNEVDDAGFFAILREAGVNWVRIRVWNDPYDSKGNSYGGGHNDLQTAIMLGRLATEAGMKVMIDFHYSDFWA
ncbi:MAG: glycosyl hydrolase 53 family protein, partial [Lachnospiraceae bacterium]|nr:glycosyl hydrolase 53 family protein [Lachnospiraceae bacterium]